MSPDRWTWLLLGAGQPPVPERDPEEVRRLAEDILDREEFQEPSRSLFDRIVDWIGDLFPDGGGGGEVPSAGSGGSGGSAFLTVVLLLAAAVGIALAVRALLGRPRRKRSEADDEPAVDVALRRSAREWDTAAADHEAAGRWKDALRCRFRALVEDLGDGGFVPEEPGRTSGELRGDLGASLPAAAGDFAAAADLFDRAWYGDAPAGPGDVATFVERAGSVRAAARRAGAAKDVEAVGA